MEDDANKVQEGAAVGQTELVLDLLVRVASLEKYLIEKGIVDPKGFEETMKQVTSVIQSNLDKRAKETKQE